MFYESKFNHLTYDGFGYEIIDLDMKGIKGEFQVHFMNEMLVRYDLKLLHFLNDGTYGDIFDMMKENMKLPSWVDGLGYKINSRS